MSDKQKNKLIPKLRFPEFKNSGEWNLKLIGSLISESRLPSKSNDVTKRITVRLNLKGVEKRRVRGTESDNATSFFVRKKGQFIYGKQNLHKGAFGIIPDELDGYESSQDIPAFDFNKGVFPYYFFYYLSQESIYPKLDLISTGTGSKRIHPKDLFQVEISIPKLKEQQKIASFLSNLDKLIEAHNKKLDLLKRHKKGLMQNLFPQEGEKVPKLRFPEFKDSGEWEYVNGDKLFETISNKNHNSELPILAITQEHGAVPRDKIDYSVIVSKQSIKNYKVVEKGDFIISLRSFQGGIEYSNYKGLCSPAYIVLRKKTNLEDIFFKYYFKTDLYIRQLNRNLEGIRDGKMVSFKQFSEILLPKPSLPEQQKIGSFLSSLDELIKAEEKKIELLKKHKKGLMQGLFPNIDE